MSTKYDVIIIIGSGAGGGTLARHLAPSGKSILILERGDWLKREQQNWDAEEVFIKNRYVPKETWYDKTGKPFQPGLHYFVGGATKMFGAALYRLRKEDFGELEALRWDFAGLAHRLRGRSLITPGRADVPSAWRAWRRPRRPPSARPILSAVFTSRTSNNCMMISRAESSFHAPAASCPMSRMRRSAPAFAARTAMASRAGPCQIRRRGAGGASGPPSNVTLLTNAAGSQAQNQSDRKR
jgi:choline dehydrogenase-like flavoprotein